MTPIGITFFNINKKINAVNKFLIIFILFPFSLYSQPNCDELTTVSEIELIFDVNGALKPDPCGAKTKYDGNSYLKRSPEAGYEETVYNVIINHQTIINEKCESNTVEISRDTVETGSNLIFGEIINRPDGNYYTIRLELLRRSPKSRPKGCLSSLIPDGNGKISGYWVTTFGKYSTSSEASEHLKDFKIDYPEFCRAYVYKLPSGIQYQYGYR